MRIINRYSFLYFTFIFLFAGWGVKAQNSTLDITCNTALAEDNIESVLNNNAGDYTPEQTDRLLNITGCLNKLNLPSVTISLLTGKRFINNPNSLSDRQKSQRCFRLAEAWQQTGNYKEAKKCYKEIIGMQSNQTGSGMVLEAGFRLIDIFIRENKPEKADLYLNLILNIVKSNPADTKTKCRALLAKANVLKLENKLPQAIQTYRYAIDSLPNSTTLKAKHMLELATLYVSLNKTGEAENLLNKLNNDTLLFPADYYMVKSKLYRKRGNNNLAAFYFQNHLKSINDSAVALESARQTLLSNNKMFLNLMAAIRPAENSGFFNGNIFTIIFILITLVILAILIVIIYSQHKQLNRRKTELSKIENTKNILQNERKRLTGIEHDKINTRIERLQTEAKNKELAISELNKKIKDLRRAEKLRNSANLDIGFHIRSLLSSILGFTGVFKTEFARLREKQLYQYADIIEENANLIMNMVESYHEYTNIAAGKITAHISKINVVKTINSVVNELVPLANQKNIKLVFNAKEMPLVIADQELTSKIIKQATLVALNNTEKGFVIIDIDLVKKDKFCEIKIQNTGHGFDKAYLKNILEPFNREGLNYIPGFTGTGMEYPLINKLARLMKGKVTVDAKIEQGITFTLTLPATTIYQKDVEKKTSETPGGQVNKMPWEGLNVLVVEDDIMNRLLFSKILKQAAKLVIAEDGEKGLEAIGDFFKEGKTFDVVLMDINLPDRWDGIKLKNRIQELFSPYRKIPFIAQTAYAMQGDREKFLSEGFNEYISKPIIKKELIRVVIKALDSIK